VRGSAAAEAQACRSRLSEPRPGCGAAAVVEGQAEVVRFLAYTGLRWGEMAALRVQDFDMLRRRVNVSRSVTVNARSKGWLRWRAQVAENCAAAWLRPRPLTRGTRTSRVHVQRVAIE
jgi:integrase